MKFEDYYFNMPGRILEFFPENQTATIKICVERSFDSASITGGRKVRGLLRGVPVHVLSGGGWSVTHPITEGDTCILFFSQIGYDHWLYEDKDEAGSFKGQPMYWTNRMFDLADGYALVGLNTIPRAIVGYSPTDSEWRNVDRSQRITLSEGGNIEAETPANILNKANESINEVNHLAVSGSASIGTGATGTFSSGEGKVITVTSGIITGIS